MIAAWALAGAAAAAQVDITDANGSTVHVGAGGDVRIRSSAGKVVSVGQGGGGRGRRVGGAGCPDGALEVSGSNAHLTVAGPCRAVDVSGTENVVRVRLAPGAEVNLSGSGNLVVWTLADPKGAPPHIEHSGFDNHDRRG